MMKNVQTTAKLLMVALLIIIGCKKPEENPGGFRIACWGDSLTEGFGSSPKNDYPTVLSRIASSECYNGGLSGQTSTDIKERMLADSIRKKYDFVVIWAGRNNYQNGEQVKADIAKMVNYLGHKRYCVLSVLNADIVGEQGRGGKDYEIIMKLNNDLESLYGIHYADVRSYLISKANLLNAKDNYDKSNDIIPFSLRVDNIHLNDKGYAFVSAYIYERYKTLIGKEF